MVAHTFIESRNDPRNKLQENEQSEIMPEEGRQLQNNELGHSSMKGQTETLHAGVNREIAKWMYGTDTHTLINMNCLV